jgi:transposase InsO family protein
LSGVWVQPDLRDQIVDFVRERVTQTELPASRLVAWIGIGASKFYDWQRRYGKVNEHNAWIPRDHWLEDWEKRAIIDFYQAHPDDGYRRVAYMMMDTDIVAVSPSSVYRVLSQAGVLRRWEKKPSQKGKGFAQPLAPHAHWHIDVSYLNLSGTFYYLCSILDGYSRYIVHHEIREQMTEQDVEIIVQRALEAFPDARPRIISDNGPQFVAKDFKAFIRIKGMDHVRTSPYYPQSNGKLERWHKSLKSECIRPKTPLNIDEARRLVSAYVDDYNQRRLHSAIGYVTPADKLAGKAPAILANRDRKLAEARERRAENRRLQSRQQPVADCEVVS